MKHGGKILKGKQEWQTVGPETHEPCGMQIHTRVSMYVSRVCEYECVYVHLFQVPAEVRVRQKLKQKQAATWQRF